MISTDLGDFFKVTFRHATSRKNQIHQMLLAVIGIPASSRCVLYSGQGNPSTSSNLRSQLETSFGCFFFKGLPNFTPQEGAIPCKEVGFNQSLLIVI